MATSQRPPCRMQIPAQEVNNRKLLYKNLKKPFLDHTVPNSNDEVSEIYYEFGAFLKMIKDILKPSVASVPVTGIKVYLASFKKTGDPYGDGLFPPEKENTLALVFAPTKSLGNDNTKDISEYYMLTIITPPPSTPPAIYAIPQKNKLLSASPWVANYQGAKLAALQPHMPSLRQDTRSLWYDRDAWDELVKCIEYDLNPTPPDPIRKYKFVKISFGAYDINDEITIDGVDCPVGTQMTIIFSFFAEKRNKRGKIEYVEVTVCLPPSDTEKKGRRADDDYDTGIPIPPGGAGGNSLP